MSNSRKAQFQTETPFLPLPLSEDVVEAVCLPVTTVPEAEERQARLTSLRSQVAAGIDTIEMAIAQNHADYLGGRRSWSYETSNEVKVRLRILKRQRQHLQDAYGVCNRWLKRWHHEHGNAPRHELGSEPGSSLVTGGGAARAWAFVAAAERLLAPETLALIWEAVQTTPSTNGGPPCAP